MHFFNFILQGTDIMSNMWFIHRDESNWSDPDKFDHTRHLNKPLNVPNFHPFSMGVRACPGQRIAYSIIKLITANLVLNMTITSADPASGSAVSQATIDSKQVENTSNDHFDANLMLPVTPKNIMLKFRPTTNV